MQQSLARKIETLVYTTTHPNERVHRCALLFTSNMAVSFQHGEHSIMKEGDLLSLYNVQKPTLEVKVVVYSVRAELDFIIFKILDDGLAINSTFGSPELRWKLPFCSQNYFSIGIDAERRIMWKNGIIAQASKTGFWYVGTSHGEVGDCGSGIFDDYGDFMGISVAMKNFQFVSDQFSLKDVANQHSNTKIIPDPAYAVCSERTID